MRLKSLTLKGFKSFADKKEIVFSDKIVAVVGPNGSGKSNITESFRFALGEQSMKILRSKRGEDLIYHGHQNTSSQDNANVKLVFNNSDGFFSTINFNELVIERTVYKNGENEYKLNGTAVRLKDILEILARVNIGPTGHHIISQGGADRILNATPEERKEMIEDGLGLKHLQYKKIESEKKIKRTAENIEKTNGMIREIKIHFGFLEKQVNKHKRAEKLKEELIKAYEYFFSVQKKYISHWTEKYNKQLLQLKDIDIDLSKKIADSKLSKELTEIIQEYKDKNVKVENELSELRQEKDKISRELGRLEGKKETRFEYKFDIDQNNSYLKTEDVLEAHNKVFKIIDSHTETTDLDEFKKAIFEIKDILSNLSEKDEEHKEETQKENLNVDKEIEEKNIKMAKIEEKESFCIKNSSDILKGQEEAIKNAQIKERQMLDLLSQKNKNDREISECNRNIDQLKRDLYEYNQEKTECVALVGIECDSIVSSEEKNLLDREKIYAFKKELERMKIRLEEIGIGLDDSVLKEYKTTKERYEFLEKEILDLKESTKSLKETITRLQSEIDDKFKKGIESINSEFKKLFNILFDGGTASIKLIKIQKKVKSFDEYEEPKFDEKIGIDIVISLPQKKIKELEQLSGGERSLVSIALLFSLSQITPPAFMVLDETDAALDEANSKKYGDMLEVMSKNTQLIVVTHNRETMSRADVIYGLSVNQKGASTLLSVRFDDAVKIAK